MKLFGEPKNLYFREKSIINLNTEKTSRILFRDIAIVQNFGRRDNEISGDSCLFFGCLGS